MKLGGREIKLDIGERCVDSHLFLVGVPKAGTTSIFSYLAEHPQIMPSSPKEPGYFLPAEYYLDPKLIYGRDRLSEYLEIFQKKPGGQIRLEGTTEYFRCSELAERINQTFPESKIIVSFREPVARLVSWYQMGKFHGWTPTDYCFDQYVSEMFGWKDGMHPGHRMLLEEGQYSLRLSEWKRHFDDRRLRVVWFEDIVKSPLETVCSISRWLGIDESYYEGFVFTEKNRSLSKGAALPRRAYQNVLKFIQERFGLESSPARMMIEMRRQLSPIIDRTVALRAGPEAVTERTLRKLYDYYQVDIDRLSELTGQAIPWKNHYFSFEVFKKALSAKLIVRDPSLVDATNSERM